MPIMGYYYYQKCYGSDRYLDFTPIRGWVSQYNSIMLYPYINEPSSTQQPLTL